jgi:hypothetical protein
MKMKKTEILEGYAIAIVDRGFIYVGQVRHDGEWCVIENARNIRYWGTVDGLGELALKGPNTKTKLDLVGTVRIPAHALLHLLDTEAAKWNAC